MEPLEQKENKEGPTELSEKLNLCEKEREEYLNGWRRAKADLINYKKEEMQRLE
ncbi:MAG: nucleotide exchange factor GrpE, partial [Parcubacteria group bacterium]|nr:nucleotide exchange factor GrpE [Parcubacteria group bacterium]